MPTRMSWRPGREGATLYVYPQSQDAEPGGDGPAAPAPPRADDGVPPAQTPPPVGDRQTVKAS